MLASFSDDAAYPRAKYEDVVGACAASLEKAELLHTVDIGTKDFFQTCAKIQPDSKLVTGHLEYTHAIYDNVSALMAYERDHRTQL